MKKIFLSLVCHYNGINELSCLWQDTDNGHRQPKLQEQKFIISYENGRDC